MSFIQPISIDDSVQTIIEHSFARYYINGTIKWCALATLVLSTPYDNVYFTRVHLC